MPLLLSPQIANLESATQQLEIMACAGSRGASAAVVTAPTTKTATSTANEKSKNSLRKAQNPPKSSLSYTAIAQPDAEDWILV